MRYPNTSFRYKPLILDELNGIFTANKSCILLDSARPSTKNRFSYLFYNPVKTITAFEFNEVEKLLADIDNYLKNKWLCGYLSYEASYALEERFAGFRKPQSGGLPLGWFGVFDEPFIFDHVSGTWNSPIPDKKADNSDGVVKQDKPFITHKIEKKVFKKRIAEIKEAIAKGDTYQVNFTYDVELKSVLSPFSLYKQLREKQRTPYCAFLQNEFGHVASFSPELFFNLRGRKISVKPMKGTARRGHSAEEDRALVRYLENDTKNRAENLMIVDLLRNDLGRTCKSGTVKTEKLFEVETHPTIHQMTSTISGTLKPEIKFSDLIRSIFPCGSVTGAPKIRTMEIIAALESGQRGVYCGALGYMSPKGRAAFSVPIRTLQRSSKDKSWRYRVGSGIIWDSTAEEEWKECAEKCRFLEFEMHKFELLESLLFKKKILCAADHISRMQSSAYYFGYPFSKQALKSLMKKIAGELDPDNAYKVRILLDKMGYLRWDKTVINTNDNTSNILLLSTKPVDENNPFLFHKSTHRPWFDEAKSNIANGRCFDIVFCNSKGEITEGSRSNIFIEKNGIMYTPPLSCGLLPGVLRKNLLRQGKYKEKILYPDDIISADAVYCGNSVRGLVKVKPQRNSKR